MIKQLLITLALLYTISCDNLDLVQDETQSQIITTEIPDKLSDEILVHFMDFKRSEFIEILPTFKEVVSNLLNEYFANNTDLNSSNFTQESIVFIGDNDKERFEEENRYVISKLAIKRADRTEENLPGSIVKEFLLESRNRISQEAHIEIAFINNEFVYPRRNNLDNYVIISVSLVVVVALVVLNLICQRKSEQKTLAKIKALHKQNSSKIFRDKSIPIIVERHGDYVSESLPLTTSIETSLPIERPYENRNHLRKKLYRNNVAGTMADSVGSLSNLNNAETASFPNLTRNNLKTSKSTHDMDQNTYRSNQNRQIPSHRSTDFHSQLNRHVFNPDARVAQRLASYERLPSTYDNVKPFDIRQDNLRRYNM